MGLPHLELRPAWAAACEPHRSTPSFASAACSRWTVHPCDGGARRVPCGCPAPVPGGLRPTLVRCAPHGRGLQGLLHTAAHAAARPPAVRPPSDAVLRRARGTAGSWAARTTTSPCAAAWPAWACCWSASSASPWSLRCRLGQAVPVGSSCLPGQLVAAFPHAQTQHWRGVGPGERVSQNVLLPALAMQHTRVIQSPAPAP